MPKRIAAAYVDSWRTNIWFLQQQRRESGDAGSESYDSTANAVSLETVDCYDMLRLATANILV